LSKTLFGKIPCDISALFKSARQTMEFHTIPMSKLSLIKYTSVRWAKKDEELVQLFYHTGHGHVLSCAVKEYETL